MSALAAICVSLHPEGDEFIVAAGGNEFCTPSRAQAIAEALRLSQLTGHDVNVEHEARLSVESIIIVCPCCAAHELDGEIKRTDERAKCERCGCENHVGLFELEGS